MEEQVAGGTNQSGATETAHSPETVTIQYVRGGELVTDEVMVGDGKDQVRAVYLAHGSGNNPLPGQWKHGPPPNPQSIRRTKKPKPKKGMETNHPMCYLIGDTWYCS